MYKTVLIFALFALCSVAQAAKFAKLTRDEPVVYCSAMDLITCVGDIETAWNDCSSAGSVDDIFNCIEDIIGAGSDCMSCVCEVLGIC